MKTVRFPLLAVLAVSLPPLASAASSGSGVSSPPTTSSTSTVVSLSSTALTPLNSSGVSPTPPPTPLNNTGISPSTFTAPGAFPTSLFASYYNSPTATSAQVQPVVSDPVSHTTYPFDLTNPNTIPLNDTVDGHPLPEKASSSRLFQEAFTQIQSLAASPVYGNDTCGRCIAGLEVGKFLALSAPEQVPPLLVALCEFFKFSHTCENTYGANSFGAVITQVIASSNVAGLDGQLACQTFLSMCPLPPTSPQNLTSWFAKPKPNPLPPPKQPSGQRLKVLHLSDFHLDPRYATGAEANCSSGMCCRTNNFNPQSPNATLVPAPRYGIFSCDSPYSLVTSALQAIPALTGTQGTGFAWTLYTGDLVAHDPVNQISRDIVTYTETVLFEMFKRTLGTGPVYAALGNHDSYHGTQDAQHAFGGELSKQSDWNYDHLAALWGHEGWLPEAAVKLARTHYSAYMVQRQDGLRVITLNTDMWYKFNYFNYINTTNPDTSGLLRFLTDELQDAEDAGERVWIMGHISPGWDGINPLLNPADLFYQIVDRFSPHVIANIFWGHSHEDELTIFYANNGTGASAQTAQTVAWLGPSLTPLTNLNSGFRVYEVDSATFEVMDAHTWISDVSSYPALDGQTQFGPAYGYEYNTRQTYGAAITGWGADDPLNATWWHLVTQAMEADNSLVATFTTLQGKSSAKTKPCTGDCINAKICYMRSGSASLAKQNCLPGFGSVQGKF